MRIGIVTTWFERGAAYVSKQFKEVWELDHDVYVYARGGEQLAKNDSNWNKGNITYGKRFKYSNLDFIDLKHFKKWIELNSLDIVFFNEQHMWNPVLLCHNMGIKTGAYIDYYTKETVPFFGIYDFLICNTKRHYSVFNWHPQVYYVPWGTDTNIYNAKQTKKTNKKQLVFFHSAGMNPYRKGTDFVIRSFDKLKSENSKLLIHTQTDLYKFFPQLKNITQNLIDQGKLEIIHKTITKPGLYHLGDIYVYPSRLEGIGLTIAEASACGMPVITSNNPPMNEFVVEEVNGKLIDIKSFNQRKDGYYWEENEIVLNHLTELLAYFQNNMDNLEEFKANSLQYAQNHLDWNNNSKKLLSVLKEIQSSKKVDKDDIYYKLVIYEKSRGLRFYISNLKITGVAKMYYFNLIKKYSH